MSLPGTRIPGLTPKPGNLTVAPNWLAPVYDPATDTTYPIPLREFPFAADADVSRLISRALFADEWADERLQMGRLSYIVERTGTRPDSAVAVMELGGALVGVAFEITPATQFDGSQVRLIQYLPGNDEIVEIGANPGVAFVPVAENQYGIHPAFSTQRAWDIWLTQHSAQTFTGITYQATQQTYTTVGQDFADKCGPGTVGVAITKTSSNGSSTISQAHANSIALADARAKALAAIVCPVTQPPATTTYAATMQTYTTTAADYQTKCGAGTSGAAVTRNSANGTSTVSQAAANAQALAEATNLALAAIVCSVTPPTPPATVTYTETLSITNKIGPDGVSFVPEGSETLEYVKLTTPTSGPTVSVVMVSGGFRCYLDYNNEDAGQAYRFTNRAGAKFTGNLPNADTTLNF